jgi:hypothetical protein
MLASPPLLCGCEYLLKYSHQANPVRPIIYGIGKYLLLSASPAELLRLVASDLIWRMAERSHSATHVAVLSEALTGSSLLFVRLLRSSEPLEHILDANSFSIDVDLDSTVFRDTLDFRDYLMLVKKLGAVLWPLTITPGPFSDLFREP